MERTIIGFVIVLSVASVGTNAAPVQILEAAPEQVNLGVFNTCEEKRSCVVITNTGKDTFVAAGVRANCACIRAALRKAEIPPKSKATLEIAAMLRAEGDFSHDVVIIPKDKERQAPLRIQVKGHAVEPVTCALGWPGKRLIACDLSKWTNLETVYYKEVTPVICLSAKNDRFDMNTAQIDVNSPLFELSDYRYAPSRKHTDESSGGVNEKPLLILILRPKEALQPQRLRDVVEVRLSASVRVSVPWTCQVVGDVYAQEQRISLGSLASCPEKETSIWFSPGHPKWTRVQWTRTDPLSEAIKIQQMQDDPNDRCIRLGINIDRSKLAHLPKGYLFTHITFYENEPTEDEAIPILIDGFN